MKKYYQVLMNVVWVNTAHCCGVVFWHIYAALWYFEVEIDPNTLLITLKNSHFVKYTEGSFLSFKIIFQTKVPLSFIRTLTFFLW
jgi:hypothetical protein